MDFNQHTLENGVRLALFEDRNIDTVHCGFMIKCGSRDELPGEYGLAHLIEHCFFKGTAKRKTFHILNRLDSVGGEVNAFVTKEETCVYASSLKEHFSRAFELLFDIVFQPSFPQKEMEKEKMVIMDEINSYRDNPDEMLFEEFEEKLFSGHPIAHPILGTPETVQALTRASLKAFIQRHYSTHQIVFACVGNISEKKMIRIARKYLEAIPASPLLNVVSKPLEYQPFTHKSKRDIHQVHAILGAPAVSLTDDRRAALTLLNNILGGPALNSRLNLNIREKHGFCYHIESNFQPYSDTGSLAVYFGTDEKHVKQCLKLIEQEFEKLKANRLTDRALQAYKNQLLGQHALAQEHRVNLMLAVAKSLLHFGRIDTLEELKAEVHGITPEQIRDAAMQFLDTHRMSRLSYHPN